MNDANIYGQGGEDDDLPEPVEAEFCSVEDEYGRTRAITASTYIHASVTSSLA
jgi:hypothetical protein